MKHKRYRKLANQVLDLFLVLNKKTIFQVTDKDCVRMGDMLSDVCELEEKGAEHVFTRKSEEQHA
jgi:hypothetical protein